MILSFSPHALRRSAQRAIDLSAIPCALLWGREIPQWDGRTAFHVGHREVQQARAAGVRIDEHRDTAVVVARDGTVVTVMRVPHVPQNGRRA